MEKSVKPGNNTGINDPRIVGGGISDLCFRFLPSGTPRRIKRIILFTHPIPICQSTFQVWKQQKIWSQTKFIETNAYMVWVIGNIFSIQTLFCIISSASTAIRHIWLLPCHSSSSHHVLSNRQNILLTLLCFLCLLIFFFPCACKHNWMGESETEYPGWGSWRSFRPSLALYVK